MTANAVGTNTSSPPKLPLPVTRHQLALWFASTQSAKPNSGTSSVRSAKKGSSVKRTVPTAPSRLEAEFALQLKASAVSPWMVEYRAIPTRRWRLDFAWPEQKVGVEIQGATWANGRHNRGAGMKNDADKLNALQLAGWLVLTFTAEHLKDGTAIAATKQALGLA